MDEHHQAAIRPKIFDGNSEWPRRGHQPEHHSRPQQGPHGNTFGSRITRNIRDIPPNGRRCRKRRQKSIPSHRGKGKCWLWTPHAGMLCTHARLSHHQCWYWWVSQSKLWKKSIHPTSRAPVEYTNHHALV